MVDAWPDDLPQRFTLSSRSEGFADNLLESTPDVGPPMTRRRSTAAARPFSGTLWMTTTQVASFETFFETTLAMGSLPFTVPAQRGAGTWLVKFVKAKLPTFTPVGSANHRATFDLYILP